MDRGFRYRGRVAAELRWGYRTAASLVDWTLAADPAGALTVTASIVDVDAFALEQAPLSFVVPSRPAWRWTVLAVMRSEASVTVALAQEESHESLSVCGSAECPAVAVGR